MYKALTCMAGLFWLSMNATADTIEPVLGTWVSSDGRAKQEFVPEFDGHWISTRMWFKTDTGWQLVAHGAMYRKPGDSFWQGASRTVAEVMDGVELFEFTLHATPNDSFRLRSTVYINQDKTFQTLEDWEFDGSDRYQYTVYRIEDGQRVQLIGGDWLRAKEES